MGRDARRVPLDFDWPMNETWHGYLLPDSLDEHACQECDGSGYSPAARLFHSEWYGNAPFDPASTGSSPFTVETPEVRAFAERNVSSSPDFYGKGERAIIREAERLLGFWNKQWSHHLAQKDVEALIEGGRLMDFTHTWSRSDRRQPMDPAPIVTAASVNRWSLNGLGHDSLNAMIAVEARCQRLGVPKLCAICAGHGSTEQYEGQRAEAEAWEATEPPTGEGWQMWETTSEGSPMSPVFATADGLASWLTETKASMFGSTPASKDRWLSIITGEDFAHVQIAPGVIVM